MNPRQRFYLPSVQNRFAAGINYPRILFDSGCSSILLPVTPDILNDLLEEFPSARKTKRVRDFHWKISVIVGGLSKVLAIEKDPSESFFEINLIENLFPGTVIMIKRLRFSLLSTEDIKYLLSAKFEQVFTLAE
jgi:hypothetical protein